MIRRAEERDTDICLELINILENRTFSREVFADLFREQLEDEKFACYLYEEEGKVLGLINVKMENELHHCAKVLFIRDFVVLPDCRSRGIGKQLFDHALSCAKQCGCTRAELETGMQRTRAHAFYEREGMIRDHFYYTMNLKETI